MRKGFTLIEVLTVVVIIGILVGITGYTYQSAMTRSRDNTRKTDLATIKNALEQYYLENREYPNLKREAAAGMQALDAKYQLEQQVNCDYGGPDLKNFIAPKYISSIPTDPKYTTVYGTACTANPINIDGKYLYLAVQQAIESRVNEYYLAAKMEVNQNMSTTKPSFDANSRTQSWINNSGSNSVIICDNQGGASCTHNYFVKSR